MTQQHWLVFEIDFQKAAMEVNRTFYKLTDCLNDYLTDAFRQLQLDNV